MTAPLKMLSLCSGIGGIDLAAQWAGIRTAAFCEIDPFCQKVLKKQWPEVPIFNDVTKLSASSLRTAGIPVESIGIIASGFPCQPHSISGLRLASDDDRDLWDENRRIIGEINPRWYVGENVPGLLSSESRRFFGRVLRDLAALGYSTGWCCFGAENTGSVQGGQGYLLWPRPMASDWKRNYRDLEKLKRYMKKGHQKCWPDIVLVDTLTKKESGLVHPEFGEWLMGFPIGWTDLEQ